MTPEHRRVFCPYCGQRLTVVRIADLPEIEAPVKLIPCQDCNVAWGIVQTPEDAGIMLAHIGPLDGESGK